MIKDEAITTFAEKLKEYFPSIADAIDYTAQEVLRIELFALNNLIENNFGFMTNKGWLDDKGFLQIVFCILAF